MSFRSSLQFHPLWVTLYDKHVINFIYLSIIDTKLNLNKDSEFLTPVLKIQRTDKFPRFLGCNALPVIAVLDNVFFN